jgi:hypothetical protein
MPRNHNQLLVILLVLENQLFEIKLNTNNFSLAKAGTLYIYGYSLQILVYVWDCIIVFNTFLLIKNYKHFLVEKKTFRQNLAMAPDSASYLVPTKNFFKIQKEYLHGFFTSTTLSLLLLEFVAEK